MSDAVSSDLAEMCERVELTARNSFLVRGAPSVVEDHAAVEVALATAIYFGLYSRPGRGQAFAHDERASQALVARYSAVNCGRGTMESGWRFVRVEANGTHVVAKYGVEFWARADEVRPEGVQLVTGAPVNVAVPKELRVLSPGYYLFLGDAPERRVVRPGGLARFYFHVTERGGPTFVEVVSRFLNAAGIPFRAKVIKESGQFIRADSAVIYLVREEVERALPPLRLVYEALRPFLRESTPMLTLRLAPGLGAADDPGPADDSFGQHRCALVARGLLASYVDRPPTQAERLAGVVDAFRNAGVSLTEPHLHNAVAKPYPDFA